MKGSPQALAGNIRAAFAKAWKDHRSWQGKVIGAVVGAAGGFFGILTGIILGHLMDELIQQFMTEKAVRTYFEFPGPSKFYEPAPGIAAYCALGVWILSFDRDTHRTKTGFAQFNIGDAPAALAERALRSALRIFPVPEPDVPLVDTFCRSAMACHASMNPDLLAESLGARRKSMGDLKRVGEGLEALAGGAEAAAAAKHLRILLDPLYRPSEQKQERPPDPGEEEHLGSDDPWKVLGLAPNAPTAEVKSTFRRLAVQFHPDAVRNLGEDQQKSATEAFIKIRSAYREIVRRRKEG